MTDTATGTPDRRAVGRVVTAMVTPFTVDGELDLDGVARLATHLIDHGTETVLVNGTTGESPTLRDDEPWQVLHAVREAVEGRATVMVGTGTSDTAKTVAATARAKAEGADAVLVVTPYYSRPDQRGLLHHFRAVADAADLPMMVYDIPMRTGRAIDVSTLVDLAGVDNIIGVKDAANDLGKAALVLRETRDAPGGFGSWSGADELNLPLLAVGATGVVSVSAHLVGPEVAAMIEVFPTDPARARALHLACLPVHRSLFAEPSPAPLKGALNSLGLPGGPVRPPLADASPDVVKAVLAALEPIEAAR